jgi:hypothetical protein
MATRVALIAFVGEHGCNDEMARGATSKPESRIPGPIYENVPVA